MKRIFAIAGVILGLAVFGSVVLLPSGAAAWCPSGSYWDNIDDHCVQYNAAQAPASCYGDCKVCNDKKEGDVCLRCSLIRDCLAQTGTRR
jgi:uncharacterized paraquat-inducible protein A